jgi:hypothetical protein
VSHALIGCLACVLDLKSNWEGKRVCTVPSWCPWVGTGVYPMNGPIARRQRPAVLQKGSKYLYKTPRRKEFRWFSLSEIPLMQELLFLPLYLIKLCSFAHPIVCDFHSSVSGDKVPSNRHCTFKRHRPIVNRNLRRVRHTDLWELLRLLGVQEQGNRACLHLARILLGTGGSCL